MRTNSTPWIHPQQVKRALLLLLACSLLPTDGIAAVGSWECITDMLPSGHAYRLPASSGWTELGELEFNHSGTSDYVATATIFFTPGNYADSLFDIQFLLDGAPAGWYSGRVPEDSPSQLRFQTQISNVAEGIHTLGIRAQNLSSNPIYFDRLWIHPFLVNGGETTHYTNSQAPIALTSGWVTLLTKGMVSILSSKMPLISAYAKIESAAGSAVVEFRILRGTSEIAKFQSGLLDALPDGFSMTFVDKTPPAGVRTYYLQARLAAGTAASVGPREMGLQMMPRFTVFSASATATTVPSDDTWHDIAATPWQGISIVSVGPYGTDGAGAAFLNTVAPTAGEIETRLSLEIANPPLAFEVGWVGHSPVAQTEAFAFASDWELLGLTTSGSYRVKLQGRGLCQPGGNIEFRNGSFQVMPIPATKPYAQFDCPHPACCSNFPECLVYACEVNPALQEVSGLPARDCY